MTYTFIIPPELVSKIYKFREAGITPSIRSFAIAAIEMHIQGLLDSMEDKIVVRKVQYGK